MDKSQLSAPVAFFIFNRPDYTARTFARIREARPARLLVVADGPRPGRPEEAARCAQARDTVLRGVDWPCEVETLFAEENLGCRIRVSSGLDWVFSRAEEAIIVEDDTLPHPSFFPFCDELLRRYRDDARVMMISGTNQAIEAPSHPYSYQFALTGHIWGWASWRRAWAYYDVDISFWPTLRDRGWLHGLNATLSKPSVVKNWTKAFESLYSKGYDSWDWQWNLCCWLQRGLSIVPRDNLITNIGFGADATHTMETKTPDNARPFAEMKFPLVHPPNFAGDAMIEYEPRGWRNRLRRVCRKLMRSIRS